MLHLMKYDIIKKLRNFSIIFWPLVFPLILGTLFYFGFGSMEEMDFETIPVAVVATDESTEDIFAEYLDSMENAEDSQLIKQFPMTEDEALTALEAKEVDGIFYTGNSPSLSVNSSGLEQSILQTLLESFENGKQTMMNIAEKHPEGMEAALEQMNNYESLVKQVSLGGKTTNTIATFFYALIAMACMYGAFSGFGSAIWMQANLTSLAARRCVTPTHKLKLIFSEIMSSFILHFINLVILLVYLKYILKMDFHGELGSMLLVVLVGCMIGVCMGMFIGSIGKMGEAAKIGMIIGISMTCSFLAGLMDGSMKDTVERTFPIINRINPAALITDALYCINVYDDPARLTRNLITLLIICAIFFGGSFLLIRRERYDSI